MAYSLQTSDPAHKTGKHPWWCSLIFTLALAGCSVEGMKRLGFEEGQHYACLEANDGRPDEHIRDLECTSPGNRGGMSYEEYQQARREQSR